MALLFIDGFDANDAAFKWVGGSAAGSTTTTRFSNGRALTIANGGVSRDFTASSQIFVGVACTISNLDTAIRPYISLNGDSGATTHLSVGYSSSGLILYRGALATSLATYSGVFNPNTWYHIEISATIADAGGTCIVKLNGATVINFTGDTKNAGTNTTFDRVVLASNGGYTAGFDDIYVGNSTGSAPYNTLLGDARVYSLSPSGAGSSTQFTPSSGANYTTVDELPYSATDYVSGGTTGNRDTYALADLPASAGTVYAVQNNIIAKKTDAAAISLKPALKSGATVYYGAATSLGASDGVITDLYTTDPATSSAWTASGVNSLEAGFEVA
jgi:hypothetical protein